MATTETVTILRIDTQQPVKSIGDLKENIKALKDTIKNAQIGSDQYKEALSQLQVNQNALKDAMYATNASLEDVTKAATNANVVFDDQGKLVKDDAYSYNSLVHAMASYKNEFRSTTDAVTRAKWADKIRQVNDALKEMDAAQGNFQRNVGNYEGALKNWSTNLDALDKGLKAATGGVHGMKDGVDAFAKSPAIASFALNVSVAMKLVDALKENETATTALKKGMEALKPVTDFIAGIVEKLAEFLADIIGKVSEFVASNGLFPKIVKGVMGVGNAIVQFITTPIRGIIAAIKVFQEEGIKGIRNAAKAFGNEMKTGVSFKSNYEAGAAAADAMMDGMASRKKKAKDTGKAVAKEVKNGISEELLDVDKLIADLDKAMEAVYSDMDLVEENANKKAEKAEAYRLSRIKEDNEARLAALEEFYNAALERGDLEQALEYDTQLADLRVEIAEEEKNRKLEKEKEYLEARKAAMQSAIDFTSGMLNTLADLYEADEKGAKKNAKKIKALRIASATIETISGAVSAFTSAVKAYGVPWGLAIGAASAATVTATGVANIAKMRATPEEDTSGSTAPTVSASTPAVVQAPELTTQVSQVRTVTSASEEDRLNAMTYDRRVVLVTSDLEVKQNQQRVQVAEASF